LLRQTRPALARVHARGAGSSPSPPTTGSHAGAFACLDPTRVAAFRCCAQ
jgi:hypothetical protein